MVEKNLKEEIIKYISEKNSKYATYENLQSKFTDKSLDKTLKKLLLTGELICKNNKYRINHNPVLIGTVILKKNGLKIIQDDEHHEIPLTDETSIYYLPGDTIKYRLVDNIAHAFELVNRIHKKQLFQVVIKDGHKQLEYTSGSFYLKVPTEILEKYPENSFLLIDVSNNKFNGVLSILDNSTNQRDRLIAYNYGFDDKYNFDYLSELDKIPTEVSNKDIIGRTDFRHEEIFTIDCDNTRDMDDALSIKILSNGNYLLTGHIASVSEYIKFMGPIFKKAMERGNSFYTQRSVFPMLHRLISNGICSLNPGIDRLTKSLTLEITPKGKVINRKLEYGVINSKMKMKYSEVEKLFTKPDELSKEYYPFIKSLTYMKKLSDTIDNEFKKNGKIELDNRELEILYDSNNEAEKGIKQRYPISRKIIEVFMLLINYEWTKILVDANFPVIYRNHESSDLEKVEKAYLKVKELGYDTSKYEETLHIRDLITPYINSPVDYMIISNIVLSAFKLATYNNFNKGHFGTGFDQYAQFSSDIRRASDLLNHYSTDAFLTNNHELANKIAAISEEIAKRATFQERQAEKAEAESLEYDLMEIAKKNIGYIFEGIISEQHFGKLYVRLNNGIYGILSNYEGNIKLGDYVYVKIEDVNFNKKEIKLSFQGKSKSHKKQRTRTKKR